LLNYLSKKGKKKNCCGVAEEVNNGGSDEG
jgi:hypothetical protein